MITKTIKFKNLDGEPRERRYYFHLTRAEILQLEMTKSGGISYFIKAISEAQDNREIMGVFKELIVMSVGRRDPNGDGFIKPPEETLSFTSSEAYSEMFFEFLEHPELFAQFIAGLVPEEMGGQIRGKILDDTGIVVPAPSVQAMFREKNAQRMDEVKLPADEVTWQQKNQEMIDESRESALQNEPLHNQAALEAKNLADYQAWKASQLNS